MDTEGLDPRQSAVAEGTEQVAQRMRRLLPEEGERRAVVSLFAEAVECCHDERPAGWYAQAKWNGLWLSAGRLTVCQVGRGFVYLSVVGPIDSELLAELGVDEDQSSDWKAIPGALYLKFPAGKAAAALPILREPLQRFVDQAMVRMQSPLEAKVHSTAAVTYAAGEVGRSLPQPVFDSPEVEPPAGDEGEDPVTSKVPMLRGRAPIFEKSHRTIVSLLGDIRLGRIALPDLQRPFVWEATKVRDLLDSLFVGYPTGTVVLWQTDEPRDARVLGGQEKADKASLLVIDGQQRLTSLFAVLQGEEVQNEAGEKRRITIAFRPRDGKFEVPSAATAQDPEFLADISSLWHGKQTNQQTRRELLARLKDKGRAIDEAYEDAVEHNLERLKAIEAFEFPVIEIRKNEASDEQVADIFVRINNQGTRLGQADFVLTLLSVYHGALRDKIEKRAVEMTAESNVSVDTQQLLRAACAVAFERAKMSAIYRSLRGVDPSSGEAHEPTRKTRLEQLDRAAEDCLSTTTWRDYLLRVSHAGFVNQSLVAAPNAVMNAFAFYVKGRRAGQEKHKLDSLISRWLFATLLTSRYSTSAETVFEADLARVRNLGVAADRDGFQRALDEMLAGAFTDDYWSQTLVGNLTTQRNRAPSALAFRAAQIVLGARALFSDSTMQTMLTPGPSASRAATEQHHLFPKSWLVKSDITDRAQINQVANLADVGWNVNAEIGASAPSSYVPRMRDKLKLDDGRWSRMCAEHALPVGWESLDYVPFLAERRRRMADIIRAAFHKLGGEEDGAPVSPPWFLPGTDRVWKQIAEAERALRDVVRQVYIQGYGDRAAERIQAAIPENSRESLARALRARPVGADPLTVIDYLYLAQLPVLLFANDVWGHAKTRMSDQGNPKQRLNDAIAVIAPVRNEIAHVREVEEKRLQKASVACNDVLEIIRAGAADGDSR